MCAVLEFSTTLCGIRQTLQHSLLFVASTPENVGDLSRSDGVFLGRFRPEGAQQACSRAAGPVFFCTILAPSLPCAFPPTSKQQCAPWSSRNQYPHQAYISCHSRCNHCCSFERLRQLHDCLGIGFVHQTVASCLATSCVDGSCLRSSQNGCHFILRNGSSCLLDSPDGSHFILCHDDKFSERGVDLGVSTL